jgi:hypothetical protein
MLELAAAVITALCLPAAAPVLPPSSIAVDGDTETAFAKSFPEIAGAHRVTDWPLYTALVGNDLVAYAARLNPAIAEQVAKAAGKGYQTEELETRLKADKGLRASFDRHRLQVATMVVYADGGAAGNEGCRHPLVYLEREFRLVLGQSPSGQDPLASATVAPRCLQGAERGFQITAGKSSRFKCWNGDHGTTCGWRLPDMPAALKQVIESEYPRSLKARWHWRGLGGVVRLRPLDGNGNKVAERDSVVLTVPAELALDFVDEAGRVRWSAVAAGWAPAPAPQARR